MKSTIERLAELARKTVIEEWGGSGSYLVNSGTDALLLSLTQAHAEYAELERRNAELERRNAELVYALKRVVKVYRWDISASHYTYKKPVKEYRHAACMAESALARSAKEKADAAE